MHEQHPSSTPRAKARAWAGVEVADAAWRQAIRAHLRDAGQPGLGARLRSLSEAAAAERDACRMALDAGLAWHAVPGAERAEPPAELRSMRQRPGPRRLWARFDVAVEHLNRAGAGQDLGELATAFGAVADTAGMLAEALEQLEVHGAEKRAAS
jgi:hypothetical protein